MSGEEGVGNGHCFYSHHDDNSVFTEPFKWVRVHPRTVPAFSLIIFTTVTQQSLLLTHRTKEDPNVQVTFNLNNSYISSS